jgi:hypothetical protein
MMELKWHQPGDRVFESGLDRGVLYIPDVGPNWRAIPWSGLQSVQEKLSSSVEPVYFNGVKISDVLTVGTYSAKVTAITYPDELEELYGNFALRDGFYLGEQEPKLFGFSYRSRVGNDIDGDEAGYKIHLIYNATIVPSEVTHSTITESPDLIAFEWDLTAVPNQLAGFRPTAHIVIDTTKLAPSLLEVLEAYLYGIEDDTPAHLPPMEDVIDLVASWFLINIIDNGDGTWTARTDFPEYIVDLGDGEYQINNATITPAGDESYIITSTENP